MRLGAFLVLCTLFVPSFTQAQLQWSKQSYAGSNSRVVRGDFTGDGFPDLLLYHGQQNAISILPNKGDGTFDPTRTFTLQPGLADVTLLDFNGDGNLDVVGCDEPRNNLVILLGAGDGTLRIEEKFAMPCEWVTSGDFNGDGFVDIAVGVPALTSPANKNQVYVFLGNGGGGLGDQVIDTVDLGCNFLESFGKAADFNNDKKADLAIIANCQSGSSSAETLVVGLGDNTGHFAFHKDQQFNITADEITIDIRLGDVDQNGQIDVIGLAQWFTPPSGPGGGSLFAFMSHGDGTFGLRQIASASTSASGLGDVIRSGTVADFDGDGIKDGLVAVDSFSSSGNTTHSLRFYKGLTTGGYSLAQVSTLAANAIDMAWGDYNKDGRADVALIRPISTDVWLNATTTDQGCNGTTSDRSINLCGFNLGNGNYHFVGNPLDSRPINAIQIYVDGVVQFLTFDDLLSANLILSPGTHRVTGKAWDDQGAYSSVLNLTVQNSCSNTANRTVRICSPSTGTFSTDGNLASVQIIASAATNLKYTITQVYLDGAVVFSTASKMVNVNENMATGSHRITVKGWDSSGAFSSTVTINVVKAKP